MYLSSEGYDALHDSTPSTSDGFLLPIQFTQIGPELWVTRNIPHAHTMRALSLDQARKRPFETRRADFHDEALANHMDDYAARCRRHNVELGADIELHDNRGRRWILERRLCTSAVGGHWRLGLKRDGHWLTIGLHDHVSDVLARLGIDEQPLRLAA